MVGGGVGGVEFDAPHPVSARTLQRRIKISRLKSPPNVGCISFGNRSDRGESATARLLTVTQTCKLQGISVLTIGLLSNAQLVAVSGYSQFVFIRGYFLDFFL